MRYFLKLSVLLVVLVLVGKSYAAREDAPNCFEEAMRIYSGFSKAAASRPYEVRTNGVAMAQFLGRVLKNLPEAWTPELDASVRSLDTARLRVSRSLLGDRIEVTVCGRPAEGSGLARSAALSRSGRLVRLAPQNATSVLFSSALGSEKFHGDLNDTASLLVRPLRTAFPEKTFAPGFVFFTVPVSAGDGVALVCAFELAPGANADIGKLEGLSLAGVFSLAKKLSSSNDGKRVTYELGSSVSKVVSSMSIPDSVRFMAVANGIVGPAKVNVLSVNGFVFFTFGADEGLVRNLSDAADQFMPQTLLPLHYGDLRAENLNSCEFISPSSILADGIAGVAAKGIKMPVKFSRGDGIAMVTLFDRDEFAAGWSLSRSELESSTEIADAVKRMFQAIFLYGAEQKFLKGIR